MITVTSIMLASISSMLVSPIQTFDKLPTREIVFEVPGITCVGRFTDSLRQHVVGRLDGVHGVSFHYLKDGPSPKHQSALDQARKEGQFIFGGIGRLAFRVDNDFDKKLLIKRLLDSKLYGAENWVIVERKLLSDFGLD